MHGAELTLSFTPSEQDQIVFHGRRVVGERELQLELVEEAEARDRGVGHEGGVAKRVASAEPGSSHVDGCEENTGLKKRKENHMCVKK